MTAADSGTHVDIVTDLTLKGAVAQSRRSGMPEVAKQLTAQFADCLQRRLELGEESEQSGQSESDGRPTSRSDHSRFGGCASGS